MDIMCSLIWYTEKGILVVFLSKTNKLHVIMKKYQTNLNGGTFYKITSQSFSSVKVIKDKERLGY